MWREAYDRFRLWLVYISPFPRTDGFATYQLLHGHYKKHVINNKEFGNISEREYARRADRIWGGKAVPVNKTGPPLGPLEECTRQSDGARLRYNNLTNELGILHGRIIGMLFRPADGRAKFLFECNR